MSSFLMGYPHHVQTPMGGSAMDPKFPPTEDYHSHNGYGLPAGMPQSNTDYMHHQSNSIHHNANNFNYSQGITGHFYHHHHGYNAQMHTSPTNGYSSSGYYGSYYGSTAGHQIMDLPLQCSASTEPTNTVLGLQELGLFINPHICYKWNSYYFK